MNQKNSATSLRPSSSTTACSSRQVPVRASTRFSAHESPVKTQPKAFQTPDQSSKSRQQRNVNSARVSQERTSFSPEKVTPVRSGVSNSANKNDKASTTKKAVTSSSGTRNNAPGFFGSKKEFLLNDKVRFITSPSQVKPTSPSDVDRTMGRLQLDPSQASFDFSQYSAKSPQCPSGLLAAVQTQEESMSQKSSFLRKNSSGLGHDKYETESVTASTDYSKTPKVPEGADRQESRRGNNVPGINMKPVKKSREDAYRSAPTSIDRYEFYADNFSLGNGNNNNNKVATQRPAPIDPKIAITITQASKTNTPSAVEVSGSSMFGQFFGVGQQQNSSLTMASPKLSPFGMLLNKTGLKTYLEGDSEEKKEDHHQVNSAYLLPKESYDKTGKKQRHTNSMINFKKPEEEKAELSDRSVSEERERVLSKDRNVLVQPGSNNYGKFAKIYKGIENRDSWKFNMDRFKKLERQSAVKLSTERGFEPKKISTLEQERTSIKRDMISSRGDTVGNYSLHRSRAGFETDRRDQNQSMFNRNELSSSRFFEESRREEERDTLGGALAYLSDLKAKGLLEWLKSNKNSLKLYQELEVMKREIENINSHTDHPGYNMRREELEGKLLLLLDMTVNNLNAIMEKKKSTH